MTSETTNQTSEENPTETKFLSIQSAESGTISQINDTSYVVELNDVSDKTILFSGRPDRILASISTSDFVGNWSVGEDSFAEDAPNAVFVVDDLEGQDTAIIDLFNPIYDTEKNRLKYDITPDNGTSIDLPNEHGHRKWDLLQLGNSSVFLPLIEQTPLRDHPLLVLMSALIYQKTILIRATLRSDNQGLSMFQVVYPL
jgi:hypothetical protein